MAALADTARRLSVRVCGGFATLCVFFRQMVSRPGVARAPARAALRACRLAKRPCPAESGGGALLAEASVAAAVEALPARSLERASAVLRQCFGSASAVLRQCVGSASAVRRQCVGSASRLPSWAGFVRARVRFVERKWLFLIQKTANPKIYNTIF